jgi:hypothetical protein
MDRITFNEHRWTKPLQCVYLAPMGRCPSAIRSSGSRQEKRATTHRCDTRHSTNCPGHGPIRVQVLGAYRAHRQP